MLRFYVCRRRPSGSALMMTNRLFGTKFAYPAGMGAYEDDFSDQPEYPAIDPETHTWNEARRKRLQDAYDWHNKIKNASCPEAKNLELNMPKQFGYKVFQIHENQFEYNSLDLYKFATRTHVASNTQLPTRYKDLDDKVAHFTQKVKGPLLDALRFELDVSRGYEKEFNETASSIDLKRSQSIISQINRILLTVLSQEIDHLKDCQVDTSPKVEAFWLLGGQQPTNMRRSRREGCTKIKSQRWVAKYVQPDDPVETPLHYVGSPLLQVRCRDPIENFANKSDSLCVRSIEEFPDRFPYFLKTFGFRHPDDSRFASIIPGHWSGDKHRCNLLAYHPRHHLLEDERNQNQYWSATEEQEEALLSQAMLVSFGRLIGQALYHGFDQFGDVEYPFSTQTIITNGLEWSFYAYQLNTISLHQLAIAKNQNQNIMWGTRSKSIFNENQNDLNDEVVGNILRFYLTPPRQVAGANSTPYLGSPIQEWEDRQTRALTFFNFREQVSQRIYVTDSLLKFRPPEMYEYEKIYKFTFNALPMEPRRRFFELPTGFPGYAPWNDPYKLKDPLYESKGIRRHRELLAKKKEEEAIEAAKKAEGAKYGVGHTFASKQRKR